MRSISLKSTTSLVLCLSLATPTFAQTPEAPFPCVTDNGQSVDGADALARAMIDDLTQAGGDAAQADPAAGPVCGPDAMAQATEAGGEELALAQATAADTQAPAVEEGMADAPVEGAADQAAADQAVADQAAADEAAANQAAADQAIADAAAADQAAQAAEEAATDAAPAPEAQPAAEEPPVEDAPVEPEVSEAPVPGAAEEVAPEAMAEPAPDVEPEVAPEAPAVDQQAIDQATDQAAADAAAAAAAIAAQPAEVTPAEPEAPAPVAPAAEAPVEPAAPAEAPAEQSATVAPTAETETAPAATDGESTIAADTSAETSTPPAEPALTPEEQAARTAEREAARQGSAAAEAAASGEQPDMAADPEVVTEEVTEDTVRSADEDFDTKVTAATTEAPAATDPATTEPATADSSKGGLSTFEKALALGLGAVVVGSILKNGDQVVSNSGDRVVVQRDGELRVLKNDDVLLRQAGSQVASRTFDDGSTLTTITREDGSVVTTIRAADGTVLRRSLTRVDGTQVQLIDDLDRTSVPVEVSTLPPVPQEVTTNPVALSDQAALEAALSASLLAQTGRSYSLEQVRDIRQVRALAPQVELAAITFETGSAAIQQSQADELAALGGAIRQIVAQNPSAIFLVEGHTDAVGDAGYNLSLSDRRAETVALALSQYFQVPPENLVTQGYGEQFLKIQTEAGERANRRAAVRNISELLTNG
ncbi:OmpA family protein [Loktanella salsilacus]|uniref:OmpA family protein n=1 Tax=Loktanella salsilacus TaxID=195913 RepID=UPI003002AF19